MNRYCLQRCWRIRQPTPAQLHLGLQATLPHTHTQLLSQAIGQTESKPVQARVDKSGLELDGCHIRASLCTATLEATAAASSRARRAAPDVAVTLDSSRSAVADSHELVPETYRLAVRPKAPKARFED